ncbi:Hypothetical_protein [Hexamita inflata]|uniref:Hypothetical_protein n=1 Tax=Hexamita inflata TaxID=28002 RepID=A0AA86QGG1_9EUKA|nr:Hypothetical protein HINF_LOCUS45388 [Hexamita inflata]
MAESITDKIRALHPLIMEGKTIDEICAIKTTYKRSYIRDFSSICSRLSIGRDKVFINRGTDHIVQKDKYWAEQILQYHIEYLDGQQKLNVNYLDTEYIQIKFQNPVIGDDEMNDCIQIMLDCDEYTENSFRILLTPEQQILSYKLKYQELMKIEQYRSEYLKYIDAKSQIIFDLWYNFYKHLTEEEKDYYTYYFQSFNPDYIGEFYKSNCQGVINDNYIKVRKDENSISLFKINQRFRQQASDM